MQFKPQLWGIVIGALLGISWILWEWRFLWIPGFITVGYVIGWAIDSRDGLGDKLKDVLRVMKR